MPDQVLSVSLALSNTSGVIFFAETLFFWNTRSLIAHFPGATDCTIAYHVVGVRGLWRKKIVEVTAGEPPVDRH